MLLYLSIIADMHVKLEHTSSLIYIMLFGCFQKPSSNHWKRDEKATEDKEGTSS